MEDYVSSSAHTIMVETLWRMFLCCSVLVTQSLFVFVFTLSLWTVFIIQCILQKWRWEGCCSQGVLIFTGAFHLEFIFLISFISSLFLRKWKGETSAETDQIRLLEQWCITLILWISFSPFHLASLRQKMQKVLKDKNKAMRTCYLKIAKVKGLKS